MFGAERARGKMLNEQTGKVLASVMIGALACAGCAGVSYFKSAQAKEQEKQQPAPTATTSGPVSPSPNK